MSGPRSGSTDFADTVPADRRREILVACIRVLGRRGFNRTRMSDIADEIGVTAPLLLHYFGSKNELIIEALVASDEPYLLKFRERFEAGVRPEQLLVEYVEDSVWPPSRERAWWCEASTVWMNGWVTALHDPSIASAREAEDLRWREALADVVRAGQDAGAFSDTVDADTFVRTLFALMDGFMVQIVLEDPGVSNRFAHGQSMRFLARELDFDSSQFSTRN